MLTPHEHVQDYVDDYVHELLTDEERAIVDQHCSECEECNTALLEARQRLGLLMAIPMDEATEKLVEATVGRAEEWPMPETGKTLINQSTNSESGKWLARFWVGFAASVLIVFGLSVYYQNLGPGKYDLVVYGQNELHAGTVGSLRVRLINRESNRPVEDAPVALEMIGKQSGRRVRLASFTTDSNGSGSPSVNLPEWPDGDYQLVVTARKGWSKEIVSRTISLKRSWKVMLSTDKPVYQPGQTIRLRSLALRKPDLRPVAGEEAVISIRDPKGNVIFKERVATSKFGIASADCDLATEIIEGAYEINCEVGDTLSTRTVDVKKYVLPKFRLTIQCDRPYYEPGDMARVTIDSQYFFGKPVVDGDVELEIRRTKVLPTVIQKLTGQLNKDGRAELKFRVPGRQLGQSLYANDAEIEIKVVVTDSAGQQQSRTSRAVVTTRPLRVEILPETNELITGVSNRVFFFTTYADGRPAATKLSVSGFSEEIETNNLGVAVLEVSPKAKKTRFAVRARDEEGLSVNRSITLDTEKLSDGFIIRTDKAVYDSGDTVQITALGGGIEPVYVDFLKDSQTLVTETIDVSQGQGQLQFDLPSDLGGVIELCAYRFSASGMPVRKSRAIFVNQSRDVAVNAILDRGQYRPGEQAQLRLRLTDRNGQPQPGAVSLAIVDEAVYSVLADRPGSEQSFFALQEKLLQPIYALYAWTPERLNTTNPQDQQLLDQALFTRTTRVRGNRDEILRELVDKYLEGDRDILRVLERPDWEKLADRSWFPPEAVALLKGGTFPHSMSASSFPAKSRAAEASKRRGIKRVKKAWGFLAFAGFIGLLATLARALPGKSLFTFVELVVVMAIIGTLVGLLATVPALREASMRSADMNSICQLGLAIENFKASGGKIPVSTTDASEASSMPRIRHWFPETLLWRPELITDNKGEVVIDVNLADSITTWRMAASAITAEGRLGALEQPIRVFQSFFVDTDLPVVLTRMDEVSVPVIVYNYLDKPQSVELTLKDADWFELLDDTVKTIDLGPGEVLSTHYRLRANQVGRNELTIIAKGSDEDSVDAVRRSIEIVPNGQLKEQVVSGTLSSPAEMTLRVDSNAVPGSARATVSIYPSTFSQVLQGLEGIFQRPYGCFEQTSSTTYPNILALQYLRKTKQSMPQVEIAARQYIHLGYQRLLTFEVAGGGFDWFGNPAANSTLSAYGLMEFEDMSHVHNVDPSLIARTRNWLLEKRLSDGSWMAERHQMHDDPTRGQSPESRRLATTAYIAWSIYSSDQFDANSGKTLDFLLAHRPEAIESAYELALVCNAIYAIDADSVAGKAYVDRLVSMMQTSEDGKSAWWTQDARNRTMFYGEGLSGSIETTAMSTLALLSAEQRRDVVRSALLWLIQQKDSAGTWHSTQATVLALKALLAGTGKTLASNELRRIEITLDNEVINEIVVEPEQADVVQQFVLPEIHAGDEHRLMVREIGDGATAFQIVFRQHADTYSKEVKAEPLTITMDFDQTNVSVSDIVSAKATVRNNLDTLAPMVILDLPIPPGFSVAGNDLDEALQRRQVAKYDVTPRSIVIYLREIQPHREFKIEYRLRAMMPVEVTAPAPAAYLYYDPDQRSEGKAKQIIINEAA